MKIQSINNSKQQNFGSVQISKVKVSPQALAAMTNGNGNLYELNKAFDSVDKALEERSELKNVNAKLQARFFTHPEKGLGFVIRKLGNPLKNSKNISVYTGGESWSNHLLMAASELTETGLIFTKQRNQAGELAATIIKEKFGVDTKDCKGFNIFV